MVREPAGGMTARVQRDLARAISAVENGHANVDAVLATLPDHESGAFVIGVTGPPGVGKSTLVDELIARFRAAGETVAVIAVDPSSPFSGGAVLGDRVRMQRHCSDDGVFIRSMASREAVGGLAPATHGAIALCARAGFRVIVVETVGIGQVELEIVGVADVVAVVTVPGLGDGVQAIKAGLTEIADLFIVNMADRPGAAATALELTRTLHGNGRQISVLQTIANVGRGLDEVVAALRAARAGEHSNAQRAVRFEALRSVREAAVRKAGAALASPAAAAIFAQLAEHRTTRGEARQRLITFVQAEVFGAD